MTLLPDLACRAPSPEPWPTVDISLLDEREGAPPPFPLDVLPPFWRQWTEDAAAGVGAPVDYVALSLLTAAGSLMPDRRVMAAPGWSEPCILWTALIGPPSCGKTWALESACGLLGDVESRRQRSPANPDGRTAPEPLFTNATSLGGVLEAMQKADSRGMLLVRDEQGGWLSHMARGTRDGNAHAFWLAGWCQRGLEFGWRGKTVELDRPSLAILGTAHPEALVPALARDDGGVLARFLFVRPLPGEHRWPVSRTDGITAEAAVALQRLCRWSRGEQLLPLTPEALAVFERFGRENVTARSDLAGKEAAWWGKGPSQVLRLAGVLTFLEWSAQPRDIAEPQQVPARAVEAAARLWSDHLWPHARATFRIAGAGAEREDRKRQVLRWLVRQRLQEVSREQLRREALLQALDAAATGRLIEELAEGGWLREVAPAQGGRGRRRRRWHLHPGLWLGARQEPALGVGAAGASPAADATGAAAAGHDTAAPVPAISAGDSHTATVAALPSTGDEVEAHPSAASLGTGAPETSPAESSADRAAAGPRDAISDISATESDAAPAPATASAANEPPAMPSGRPSATPEAGHAGDAARRDPDEGPDVTVPIAAHPDPAADDDASMRASGTARAGTRSACRSPTGSIRRRSPPSRSAPMRRPPIRDTDLIAMPDDGSIAETDTHASLTHDGPTGPRGSRRALCLFEAKP